MAKRKARKTKQTSSKRSTGRGQTRKGASGKRPTMKSRPARRAPARKRPRPSAKRAAPKAKRAASPAKRAVPKATRLNRERRTLDESVQMPPSSLDMDRRGTAVRTGRAEFAQSLRDHKGMSPAITGGDMDVDVEDAYFTGDEAPGGDNPTPDQDVVDDIGKALGVEYQDNEELKAVDKVAERDRKRWELDPASSEDYKDRK
jgi:hypothetical protein